MKHNSRSARSTVDAHLSIFTNELCFVSHEFRSSRRKAKFDIKDAGVGPIDRVGMHVVYHFLSASA